MYSLTDSHLAKVLSVLVVLNLDVSRILKLSEEGLVDGANRGNELIVVALLKGDSGHGGRDRSEGGEGKGCDDEKGKRCRCEGSGINRVKNSSEEFKGPSSPEKG